MTTLYAQSTGNWDAINWNTAANGSGSNQTPGASDTLVSNSYTVTVNGDYTVTKVTNTSGGTFTLANGVTLTCTDGTSGVLGASSGAAVTMSLNTPNAAYLVANVMGGGNSQAGVLLSGTGSLTITGNVVAGSVVSAFGVYITAAGTLVVTGNCTGGTSCHGIYTATGIAFVMTVTGTVTGGTNTGALGIYNQSITGQVRVIGSLIATAGGGYAVLVDGTTYLTGPFISTTNGYLPVLGTKHWRMDSSVGTTYFSFPNYNLSGLITLYTADNVGGNPSAANVRYGTVYGPANEVTGTCRIPAASSVAYGALVDATTGTAVLTQEAASAVMGAIWAQG